MVTTSEIQTTMPASGAGARTSAKTGAGANGMVLGKDDFMKLLVTQMENQDPLNPLKDTEFIAQLAQFSSLEQLYGINEGIQALVGAQRNAERSAAVSFLGKQVRFSGDTVTHAAGGSTSIGYSLPTSAQQVTVQIYGPDGRPVRKIDEGIRPAGSHRVTWDGRNDAGTAVPAGEYRYTVSGMDAGGKSVTATTESAGIVTAVEYDESGAYLSVGGRKIPLGQVTEAAPAPETSGESANLSSLF